MNGDGHRHHDRTPGVEQHESTVSVTTYTVGLGLAILATIASFAVAQTDLLWPPGISVGLIVLALAQIGVHLVFFLHLGSGPDDTNNILALAFGVLIVFLVIAGSIWITANLHDNMMEVDRAEKHVRSPGSSRRTAIVRSRLPALATARRTDPDRRAFPYPQRQQRTERRTG
jgi:cytochrome o ubiquinol oxidase operon protein cyoD